MEVLIASVAALVASATWLYQKTWERREQRLKRYEVILGLLPAFTADGLDPDRIDEILRELRTLWLWAPKSVVDASDSFVLSVIGVKPDPVKEELLAEFIQEMRADAQTLHLVLPLNPGRLDNRTLVLRSATRAALKTEAP